MCECRSVIVFLAIVILSSAQGGTTISKHDQNETSQLAMVMRSEQPLEANVGVEVDSHGHISRPHAAYPQLLHVDGGAKTSARRMTTVITDSAGESRSQDFVSSEAREVDSEDRGGEVIGNAIDGDEEPVTTTTLQPPDCKVGLGGTYEMCLIYTGHECLSKDTRMDKSATGSLEDCADAVNKKGGKYFVYGTGAKKGECYQELPEFEPVADGHVADVRDCYIHQNAATCCPQLWERDFFDFYIIISKFEADSIQNSGSHGVFGAKEFLTICVAIIGVLFRAPGGMY